MFSWLWRWLPSLRTSDSWVISGMCLDNTPRHLLPLCGIPGLFVPETFIECLCSMNRCVLSPESLLCHNLPSENDVNAWCNLSENMLVRFTLAFNLYYPRTRPNKTVHEQMLFTFRASLCYFPAQRRDLKRLPVDCLYVAVWWCTCESWNGHAGGRTLPVQYMYGQSCVFRDYGWAALLSPRVLLCRIPYIYCSSVLISGILSRNLPKISDVMHILLENGYNTYATQNFPFSLRPFSSHVACLKKPLFGARVRYSLFSTQNLVSWFGDLCLVLRFVCLVTLPRHSGIKGFVPFMYKKWRDSSPIFLPNGINGFNCHSENYNEHVNIKHVKYIL